MANIKISELNELETRHRNDLLPIVDSVNNETKKIKVENLINENVELIAVSPTAPSECSLGDKYFNTTSNKIYTAVATDTWSIVGENAVEGILYVVFGDQSTYAYNGTTLINVGGSGNYSELDGKPSINGNTLNGNKTNAELGIPNVLNEYSTSTTDGYSCNYVNIQLSKLGKTLWTGNFTSGSITVPGINKYTLVLVFVGGAPCIGSPSLGGCVFGGYAALTHATYAYRLNYNPTNETLTIDIDNKGGTGANQDNQPIQSIIGIF